MAPSEIVSMNGNTMVEKPTQRSRPLFKCEPYLSFFFFFKYGAGDLAQWLRELAVAARDQGSTPAPTWSLTISSGTRHECGTQMCM